MVGKTRYPKNPTYAYHKSGEPFDEEPQESDQKILLIRKYFRKIQKFRQFMSESRIVLNIPTNELFDVIIEEIEILQSLIESRHYTSSKRNPEVRMVPGQIDEFMNEMFKTVFDKTGPQEPDIARSELLKQIKLDMISIKRNGVLSRSSFSPPSGQKAKKTEKKGNGRKKKRFHDTKKTKEAIQANLVYFPPRKSKLRKVQVYSPGKEPWYMFIPVKK